MYAQLITAQIRPDRLDELSRVFARPGASQGLQASWLLLDRDTCKCLELTVWASEAELRAGQRDGLRGSAEQALRALAGAPTREVFEVLDGV